MSTEVRFGSTSRRMIRRPGMPRICMALTKSRSLMSSAAERATRATCGAWEMATASTISQIFGPRMLTSSRANTSCGKARITSTALMIVMELADKSLYDRFVECQAEVLPGIPRAELLRYLSDAAVGLDFMIE